jgi:hypothetical protein
MKRISFIALVIILTACTFGRNSEVNTNQQKWNDASIQHYRFELSIGCFCAFRDQMPITVEVQNGAIVSMTGKDGSLINTTDPNYANFSQYATIDSLFAELKTDLAKADQVTVTYDPTYGFPATINIDFIKAAADDELYLSASGFEKLP